MRTSIFPLKAELSQEYMQDILYIDADTPGEVWSAFNFSYDLPGKWDFSFFSMSENRNVSGFLIASRKETSIHIHRLAVGKNYQSKGIGKQLVEAIIMKTTSEKLNRVTLKVSMNNVSAISFYKKLGFRVYTDEGDNHCMEIKLPY